MSCHQKFVDLPTNPQSCECSADDCQCDSDDDYEWKWDNKNCSRSTCLSEDGLEVQFNNGYSSGTAVARGKIPLEKGRHHYWEVKMITPVYGTDVMVGLGTEKVNLNSGNHSFCSLLGSNQESFGFSYKGYIHFGGKKRSYGSGFAEGSLVGVHLDNWKGTLQFFVNREPIGMAFVGLKNMKLYPMVSSTAACSKMRLTCSSSMPVSLQTECLSILRPRHKLYLTKTYPGLRYLSESIFANILPKYRDDCDLDNNDDFLQPEYILDDYDFILIALKTKRRKYTKENEAVKVTKSECT